MATTQKQVVLSATHREGFSGQIQKFHDGQRPLAKQKHHLPGQTHTLIFRTFRR